MLNSKKRKPYWPETRDDMIKQKNSTDMANMMIQMPVPVGPMAPMSKMMDAMRKKKMMKKKGMMK